MHLAADGRIFEIVGSGPAIHIEPHGAYRSQDKLDYPEEHLQRAKDELETKMVEKLVLVSLQGPARITSHETASTANRHDVKNDIPRQPGPETDNGCPAREPTERNVQKIERESAS